MSDPRHHTVIAFAPEAAAEGRILRMSELLQSASLLFRSAAVLSGTPQLLDLLYPLTCGSTPERAQKLPAAFLSYAEYSLPTTLVLLESANPGSIAAHQVLQSLKGASLPAADSSRTIRGLSPSTMCMYSYVHVPDEEALVPLISFAFPAERSLAPPRNDGEWDQLQQVLSSTTPAANATSALRRLVARCCAIVRLSGVRAALEAIQPCKIEADQERDLQWPGEVAAALSPFRTALQRVLRSLRGAGFAARRLALVAGAGIWLCTPERWDLAALAELPSLLAYAGVQANPIELQLVRAWIAYGPSGSRIPLRRLSHHGE